MICLGLEVIYLSCSLFVNHYPGYRQITLDPILLDRTNLFKKNDIPDKNDIYSIGNVIEVPTASIPYLPNISVYVDPQQAKLSLDYFSGKKPPKLGLLISKLPLTGFSSNLQKHFDYSKTKKIGYHDKDFWKKSIYPPVAFDISKKEKDKIWARTVEIANKMNSYSMVKWGKPLCITSSHDDHSWNHGKKRNVAGAFDYAISYKYNHKSWATGWCPGAGWVKRWKFPTYTREQNIELLKYASALGANRIGVGKPHSGGWNGNHIQYEPKKRKKNDAWAYTGGKGNQSQSGFYVKGWEKEKKFFKYHERSFYKIRGPQRINNVNRIMELDAAKINFSIRDFNTKSKSVLKTMKDLESFWYVKLYAGNVTSNKIILGD